jgi:hypothetical protein
VTLRGVDWRKEIKKKERKDKEKGESEHRIRDKGERDGWKEDDKGKTRK